MGKAIELYINPRTSRLEKWREEITNMRRLNWPNDKVAEWLEREKKVKVSGEAVRKFCRVRNIQKGDGIRQRSMPKQHKSPRPLRRKNKQRFQYDDSQPPIDIHK